MAKTKMTTEELLGTFEEMTVLELKEFLDAFEEKFDVTAAAPVAMAAAPAAGGGDGAAAAAEEKDEFDVVITGAGLAGLETVFCLRHQLGDAVELTLVSNDKNFVFRPDTIFIPFGADPKRFAVSLERPLAGTGTDGGTDCLAMEECAGGLRGGRE